MATITRTEAIEQIQEVLKAYENKIRDIRFNTEKLSPEGKNIVDSYCSNEENEQVLVKKAYSKKKFFKKVNETQLLEFYKVCYELNKNLSLDVKELLLITDIEEDKESFWESFWGALQGEFNEDPSGLSIMLDMGLNFIPFVGQVLDARDILACLDKLIRQKRTHEIMIWVTLVLTAIGCVPYAGDVIKAIGKAIVKGADDIIITLLKKLDAEDVYKAFIKFYNKINESTEEAIKIINQWLLEAEKRYNETDLSELIRNANEYINKAIEFIQTKIDEFAQKMFGKGCVAKVVDSVKKSPEEILREAGYKRQSLIDQNTATIEKLQLDLYDDELIKILSKMKKKGLEKSIEHVNNIIDVIDNIHVTKHSLVINNADEIYELKKYYTTQEITDILNNVSTENFETTIKKMTNIQKELLSKNISSGETNKFTRELLTELELKHGITEERLNVLRNLDYNKMTQSDYEKIKPEIDAIISLTKSYDLNKVKPGMMRKYIPVEDVEKYLSGKFGDRSYDGIRGFIARQDDVLQLKTFDDIFYTMRLDYEGNTFVYNREIAYIDFSATTYEDTFVPIGKLYEGTEITPSPFGGMGLLKTENNQIVREYKVNYGKALEFKSMEEAIIYKMDKNGNTVKIAVFNGKKWIKQ